MNLELYLWVKWVHILSATVLFGTGVGSAFYFLAASHSRDPGAMATVSRLVVRADWLFTAPSAVLQPLSGLYLVHLSGLALHTGWVFWSLLLYGMAIACWLPVVVIQIRMRDLSAAAQHLQQPLPRQYQRYFHVWVSLGCLAFIAFLGIFYLMVMKPSL